MNLTIQLEHIKGRVTDHDTIVLQVPDFVRRRSIMGAITGVLGAQHEDIIEPGDPEIGLDGSDVETVEITPGPGRDLGTLLRDAAEAANNSAHQSSIDLDRRKRRGKRKKHRG